MTSLVDREEDRPAEPFSADAIGEIHRTHINLRRLNDDMLRLAGEQGKITSAFIEHTAQEATWRLDVIASIERLHACVENFHGMYEPTLTAIMARAKYWNDTRDFTVRALIISVSASIIAGIAASVWFYLKFQVVN